MVGGGALEGATVMLQGTSYSATTNASGYYEMIDVAVGSYTAECSASGYQTATAPVTIEEGMTATQDFELEEASDLDPPVNFMAEVQGANMDDVYCTWEPPGGGPGPGEWINWDAGVNTGNGIGLTNGGTFYTASHWLPAELTAYDGANLSKINFFANGDAAATYELMIWTGANAGTMVYSQVVPSFTVDDWNEIILTTPHTIDASQELWFGYAVTHGVGTFPAGCDDGPAVQYSGDMISLDGTAWVSMSFDYGLDYNWNIWGWVEETDVAYPVNVLTKEYTTSTGSLVSSGSNGTYNKFEPTATKDLLGYNVYNTDGMVGYTTALEYTDMGVAPGTYDYWATAVYDEGESGPSNTDQVTIEGGTSGELFCDDFESYTVGEQLVVQNPVDWTTWSGTAGNAEDPYIFDQDGNTVNITGTNDAVYVIPNYISGEYEITFDLYVPTGGDAYFNTLQYFEGAASQWGMQVYFGHTNYGEGNLDAGAALAQIFTFEYDSWMAVKVYVDLDSDWAEFYLDDVLIIGWVWSTGSFGTGTLNQLGGSNFYAWPDGVNANPNYYFDNYCLWAVGDPPLDPPQNVTATLQTNEVDVLVEWDPPAGGGTGTLVEFVQHDGTWSNALYQSYDFGYGVVFDVSAYPGCTIEYADFRHSPWGFNGTWDYKIHIVDWDTYTEVHVTDVMQTTGDDQWEENVPLGSVAGQSGLVGIFLEPMSNDPADAYPCLDGDNVLDGMSFSGALSNYSAMAASTVGDFLVDLWIMTDGDKVVVKPPKVQMTGTTNTAIARNPSCFLTRN